MNDVKESNETIANNNKSWLLKNGYPNFDIKLISIPTFSFGEKRTSGKRVLSGNITLQFALRHLITNEYVRNEDGSLKIHELKLENISAQRIRLMIGLTIVKGYLIDKIENNGKAYVVSGRGYGHGAGMSQWGAKQMADKGKDYQDILLHYYPGTTLTTVYQVGESNLEPNETTKEVLLTIGRKQATINGKTIQLDVSPEIINMTTFVPIRFVVEQFNGKVVWNPTERTVTIKRTGPVKQQF